MRGDQQLRNAMDNVRILCSYVVACMHQVFTAACLSCLTVGKSAWAFMRQGVHLC